MVSPTITETIPIESSEDDSLLLIQMLELAGIGLTAIVVLGAYAAFSRRSSIKSDLAEIESWAAFQDQSGPDS